MKKKGTQVTSTRIICIGIDSPQHLRDLLGLPVRVLDKPAILGELVFLATNHPQPLGVERSRLHPGELQQAPGT